MVGYRNVPVCAGSIPQWKNSQFLVVEDLRVCGKTRRQKACQFYGQEHPRVCGENEPVGPQPLWLSGTSPRARGKLGSAQHALAAKRNIPAHAGKTSVRGNRPNPVQEHPRARGENAAGIRPRSGARGTSPRTRGKRYRFLRRCDCVRNIPAHAGKTPQSLRVGHPPGEHPRARGENIPKPCAPKRNSGTSPRTRGKRTLPWTGQQSTRNIPAHAGKTLPHPPVETLPPEHPRVRGENRKAMISVPFKSGTSPRTRGKRDQGMHGITNRRNIPAHAGKTQCRTAHPKRLPEHPRARGENRQWVTLPNSKRGTSPRTRGKLALAERLLSRNRNIPAHAGKTKGTISAYDY